MSTTEIVHGRLQPDGTLELDTRPTLPAGRVRVTLQSEPAPLKQEPWDVLQQIWDERKLTGLQPRSAEDIDAEIRRQRADWEDRQIELERIQQKAGPQEK